MSKGNLFLGYGRGKIGDIVLTRGEGQQISRARNRSPRNPKTEKQMYQRAVMATVMAMYKAGKTIFDHSFQGKQVALGSMKRFMSVNAKKLRENIVADLASNSKTCAVITPGAVSPVPNTYRIAEGTMSQGAYYAEQLEDSVRIAPNYGIDAYIDDVFVPGDIYTVVAIKCLRTPAGDDSDYESSPASIFGFVRLTVKESLAHTALSEVTFGDVFVYETYNMEFHANSPMVETVDFPFVYPVPAVFSDGTSGDAAGVIRSREDSGLRSNAEMVIKPMNISRVGVSANNIATVWNANVEGLGNSELILEGGDI